MPKVVKSMFFCLKTVELKWHICKAREDQGRSQSQLDPTPLASSFLLKVEGGKERRGGGGVSGCSEPGDSGPC